MKKYILVLISLLLVIISVKAQDDFTYEKIDIIDKQENNIALNSSSNTSSGNNVTNEASKTMSFAKNASGIGETPGVLSVSPSGAAVYNVPIAVPEGINGVEPEISLTYNSQSGNGIAGYGWNISGISVITRIPASKFHDGQIDGVDFDNLDRFALDGERLILKSGTYGTNGAQYETETYSNLKIVSYGTYPSSSTSGPAYFIVYYPDGSLAHYGNSSDSRTRLNYAITYWQNPQGVRISYEYDNTNAQSIKKIKYGALNSSAPVNEIWFSYKFGTDTLERFEQSFVGGSSNKRTTILDRIEVFVGNIKYRGYNLSYNSTNLKYKRLASITEVSGVGGLSHSPITFSYPNSSSSVTSNDITTNLTLANIEQRNAEVTTLDLTGNGKMDFLVSPITKDKFWLFKNLQNNSTNFAYQVNTGSFETIFPTTWLTQDNKLLAGQGITITQIGTNNDIDFKVYSNNSSTPILHRYTKSWDAPTYIYEYNLNSSEQRVVKHEYLSGDFNGDGLTDVMAIGKPYTTQTCVLDYSSPGNYSCSTNTFNNKNCYFIDLKRDVTTGFVDFAGNLVQHIANGDKLKTGDFNGDGKTDILHIANGKLFVYTLTNNNTLTLLWQTSDSGINVNFPYMLGDYNGDGLTDFMRPTAHNSYSFATYLSKGTAFRVGTKNKPFKYLQTNWNGNNGVLTGYNLVPLDFNGDGKTDIIEYTTTTYNNSSNGTQVIKIHNNLGLDGQNSSSNETYIEFAHGGTAIKTGNLKHFPIPVFLSSNQPNKNLEFASISDSWITNFSFTQDHREDVLINSISSNGVTQTIQYTGLDPSFRNDYYSQIYQIAYDETYPNIDLKMAPSSKVVSKLQRISNSFTTIKQLYNYYGAVYNANGLGFLGFKGMAVSNWHSNYSELIYTISKYSTAYRGALTDQYSMTNGFTFTVPTSGYISKVTNQYASSLSGSKVFKLKLTSSLTQNALDGININTSYVYDGYNNPTKATTNYLGTGTNVVDITYANSTGSGYYIGRPTKRVVTNTINGNTFTTEKQFIYSGYLLSQLKSKGHNTAFDIETYNYDTFGNIIKKTVTPNGEASRELEFEYDPSGRFMTKTIDVEDLETTYQYNLDKGLLVKETDYLGLETNFTYDNWNRVTKITDYLGNDVTTSYVESYNHTYTVTTNGDDGSSTVETYDALKRLTLSKQKNVMGQWHYVRYQYDKFDRPYKVSEPYSGTGTSLWNETEYDVYGRPIKVTEYTGRVSNITYNGLTVTVNDGTKTVSVTKDAMGNTVSVTDPGGTINYSYYGNGNLKTANYGGVAVSVEQDGWGRRTKLTDPSAGVYTYAYNGYGDITNETTPKGSTNYTYSSIGKLSQKLITGDHTNMTIMYGYNSVNKLLSSITSISTDGNNSNYTYAYDNKGRLSSTSESNPYTQFTTSYTYDAFGRIFTELYYGKLLASNRTSTKKIMNIYQYGSLKTVVDFNSTELLWNISGVNGRGQVTESTMGNQLRRKYTYDSYGYLTETKSENNANGSAIELMKLTTNFNTQRGTLTSKTNSMFSWSESFTYDNQDRLVNFNDNNGNNNQTYDLLGRILSNPEVGDYSYLGSSYQVKSIELNDEADLYYQNNTLQQVSYNAFKKPFEINKEGAEKIGFQYNPFMQRANMFYGDNNSTITQRSNRKHYSANGNMEISYDTTSGKTTFVTYIKGDAYSAPVMWRSEHSFGGTNEAYYHLHRDYLGSILMITDKNGNIKEKRHFDAWGNTVKLTDGSGNNLDKFVYLDRGYTGHEHLQGVGLIHMNGRLYDPKLKRFLAPDNFIQDVSNTQNFNRYSYVLNNPLMYTDPSGETYGRPDCDGCRINGGEGLSEGQQTAIGSVLSTIYNLVNWKGLRWNDIDNWATKNIFRPIQKWKPFKWIGNLFGRKKKEAKPIEYANYEGLSSDPLAGSSMSTTASFFNGGGADTNLGVETNKGKMNYIAEYNFYQTSTDNNYGTWNQRWGRSDSLLGKLSYNLVNDAFQVVQTFDFDLIPSGGVNPLLGNRANINIDGTPNYTPVNGFVNTLSTLIPTARGVQGLKFLPKGLGFMNKLNAAQFSKAFKGNLARLSPYFRGRLNKALNMGINYMNNQLSNGMILLYSLKLKREEEE